MSTLRKATDILRSAEELLRELIGQAAAKADYTHLATLADWAKQLNALRHGCTDDINDDELASSPAASISENGVGEISAAEQPLSDRKPSQRRLQGSEKVAANGGHKRTKRTRAKKSKGSRKRQSEYPKFLREGVDLVKQGWSRREKKEYEHKAPRNVISLLVDAVVRSGKGGKRFTMEELLPLHQLDDSSEVPSYQAYLSLAWLRTEGLIIQHGRQGYSLPKGADLVSSVEERWQRLRQR